MFAKLLGLHMVPITLSFHVNFYEMIIIIYGNGLSEHVAIVTNDITSVSQQCTCTDLNTYVVSHNCDVYKVNTRLVITSFFKEPYFMILQLN